MSNKHQYITDNHFSISMIWIVRLVARLSGNEIWNTGIFQSCNVQHWHNESWSNIKNISWIHLGFSVIIKYSFANVFKVE